MTRWLRPCAHYLEPVGRCTLAAALASAVLLPSGAATASTDERREGVRQQRAQLREDLDSLRSSDAVLARLLDRNEREVRTATRSVHEAERVALAAAARARRARLEATRVAAEVTVLRDSVRDTAVRAFIGGPGPGTTEALLSGEDIAAAGRARELVDAVTSRDVDAIERLEGAEHRLAEMQRRADDAAAEARVRREQAGRRLTELSRERRQQEQAAASVQDRIAERLSEAAALAQVDRALAARIEADQQALATRVARPDRDAPPGVASEVPALGRSSSPAGGFVNVGGIVVSARLAEALRSLLLEAREDGIALGGGGYRDPSGQVRLRRQNCGASEYALYEMPASRCSPPTARPGTSMHELGLAVDFTFAGRAISSRASPGFRWLSQNAQRFGLFNLPSESWHWSTTGQ